MKSRKRIFVGTIALLALLILPAASHAAITRPLTTGSSGNDVLELQETLRTKGYFTYPVSTGFFGSVTKQAVAGYQAASGLEPVGSVGPKTRALINSGGGGALKSAGDTTSVASGGGGSTNSAGSAVVAVITSSLEPGDTGSQVTMLQTVLEKNGFLTTTPSGTFDSDTVAAVIAFQASNHLETVGRVGPQTRALVNRLILTASSSGTGSNSDSNANSSEVATSSGSSSSGSSVSGGGSGGTAVTITTSNTSTAASGGSASATSSVSAVPAVTISFSSSTSTVAANGSATFTWSSTNASSCIASDGWSGTKAASGSQLISSITKTQSYTLSCSNTGGKVATKSIMVSLSGTAAPSIPVVAPPVISATSTIPSTPSTLTGSYPVYEGCEAPGTAYLRTIYFDPVNGNDSTGDGTPAKPFKTFMAFLTAHKLTPGDHIVLLPGSHGSPSITAANSPLVQGEAPRWTWIDFKSGATMKNLTITASRMIVTRPELTGGIATGYNAINLGHGNNLIVADGSIYSTKDTSAWTINDWINTAISGIGVSGTVCSSILRNDIENVRSGISVSAPSGPAVNNSDVMKSLVQDNLIKWVSSDGMHPIGSNITFRNNRILGDIGSSGDGDGSHDDGIQMFALGGAVFHDVVIDHNWIQDELATGTKWQAPWQGLDNFDGVYTHSQVTNNVVLVGGYHGISLYGLKDSVAANNVYANDMAYTSPGWFALDSGKTSDTIPYGSIAKNNVSPTFILSPVVASQNNYTVSDMRTVFKTFDLTNHIFDLNPLPGGPIDGKGIGPFPTGAAPGAAAGPTSTGTGTVPTCTLSATPVSINQEQSSTLSLTSTDAASAVIDNGVGAISVNGTKTVSPFVRTTYTATVTGLGGTNTCFAQVAVNPAVHPAVPAANVGPVIQYGFDTSSVTGTVVNSLSPYNYYGTLANGASIVPGHSGQALSIATGTQGVLTDSVLPSALGISNALTISAWVNLTASAPYESLFTHGYGNRYPQTDTISFATNFNNGGPRLMVSDGTHEIVVSAPHASLTTGHWYHLAGVIDGTTGYLYINGALVASSTNPAFTGVQAISRSIEVGNESMSHNNPFLGLIDDFRLYNRALSAGEVASLASGALAVAPPSGASATFRHQLALGSTGTEVSALQSVLQSLGLYSYPSVTGYLGQATKNAITAFQKQNQLAAVGQVGPQTRSLLNSIAASLHLSL